jgi:hypothetical protein
VCSFASDLLIGPKTPLEIKKSSTTTQPSSVVPPSTSPNVLSERQRFFFGLMWTSFDQTALL